MAYNENGFTGINPNQAMNDIGNFKEAMNSVAKIFEKGGYDFFKTLDENWYSHMAFEFSHSCSGPLYHCTVIEILNAGYVLAQSAVEAFNKIAGANGLPYISVDTNPPRPSADNFGFLKESGSDGTVGMRIDAIKVAVSEYSNVINNGLSALENVPTAIAMYDQTGALQAEYAHVIQELKQHISENTKVVFENINHQLEEATAVLNRAAMDASSTIGGSGAGMGSTGGGYGGPGGQVGPAYGGNTSSSSAGNGPSGGYGSGSGGGGYHDGYGSGGYGGGYGGEGYHDGYGSGGYSGGYGSGDYEGGGGYSTPGYDPTNYSQ